MNNFPLVWVIGNKRDQVTPLIYNIRDDDAYHLVRGRKVLRGMEYLLRSVKQAANAVRI